MRNDGAGYIEEASNLLARGELLGTPWGIEPVDLIHGKAFPSGYGLSIAAVSLLGPSTTEAAIWIARLSWMLLLGALTFCFWRSTPR